MKIAITGPDGLVGSRIIELLKGAVEFIPLSQATCDITNKESVEQTLKNIDYDLLLHLAAYTNVDGAEKERELARRVNVEGTKNLFEAAKGKKFIYISTDFVFDGTTPPYFEDSQPNPIGYYGQTKYEGEQIVKDQAMIVRISYPYRTKFEVKNDLVRTLRNVLAQGKELTMITDSTITPTFIDDIAFALKHLMQNYSPEVFHINGANSLSPFDVGTTIAKTFGYDTTLVRPTTYDEYFKGKAPRPRHSEMKSKKNNFYKMKTFEEGLQTIAKS